HFLQLNGGRCQFDASIRPCSLPESETKTSRYKRLNGAHIQIVKTRTRLPANRNRIFKSSSGYHGRACALALQKGVGSNRGSVKKNQVALTIPNNLSNGACDGLGRIAGRGKQLEDSELAIFDPDAVSEGAAGIDCDSEGRQAFLRLAAQ